LTLGLAQELKLLQALIRMAHQPMRQMLQQHWLRTEPDMVVSLIPNFNRVMGESLASTLPGVPYVTVLTDMADHPPHFWIEPGLVQHVVCGSARAVQQAHDAGHPAARIHTTSGMIIRPDFYAQDATFDRTASLRAAGLDPARATGVVMFGGHGSRSMLGIAQRLADTQLILMCGHNAKLADKLRALPAKAPRLVLEFTPKVAEVLRLGDFFIGKPGPGALSEALQLGLPVVVTRNAWTMPQERYNTDWVREHGFGLVLPSFRNIQLALPPLLAELATYRARVAAHRNRAVFELPGILASILDAAQRHSLPLPSGIAPDVARQQAH
jgi:UDP-N-acetylglucosamine:LPS N-acetylglucosamine transferase